MCRHRPGVTAGEPRQLQHTGDEIPRIRSGRSFRDCVRSPRRRRSTGLQCLARGSRPIRRQLEGGRLVVSAQSRQAGICSTAACISPQLLIARRWMRDSADDWL